MEKLSTKQVEKMLINKQFYEIDVEELVDSTNEVVKNMANNGVEEGKVVIAHSQTRGRGRLGRTFYSPEGTGIYMSILLRPDKVPEKALFITSAMAIAVCNAIREVLKINAQIKWVNDILVDDKKVCGILTEGKVDNEKLMLEYAIVGVGINFAKPKEEFPDDIKNIASYLLEKDDLELKSKLVAKILDNLYFYYNDLNLYEEVIRNEYVTLSGFLGRDVDIIQGNNVLEAKAIGVAEDMSLLIRNNEGVKKISHGELSIRIKGE